MGLADILTGMMHGPRGQRQPTSGGSSGGMSPIMMALLGLLAYKAFKGRGSQGPNPRATERAAGSTISLADCSAASQAACRVAQPPAPSPVAA
jgi:hypothetical protein